MATVKDKVANLGLDPVNTRVYICMLCVNQHFEHTIPFEELEKEFSTQLSGCSSGIVICVAEPWEAPIYLTRAWCIFELMHAIRLGDRCKYYICVPPSQREAFYNALIGDYASIMAAICAVDVAKAEASVEADKVNITKAIHDTVGIAMCNKVVTEGVRVSVREMAQAEVDRMTGAGAHDKRMWGLLNSVARMYQDQVSM